MYLRLFVNTAPHTQRTKYVVHLYCSLPSLGQTEMWYGNSSDEVSLVSHRTARMRIVSVLTAMVMKVAIMSGDRRLTMTSVLTAMVMKVAIMSSDRSNDIVFVVSVIKPTPTRPLLSALK